MKPATSSYRYRLRITIGLVLMLFATVFIAIGLLAPISQFYSPTLILLILWTIAGVGMGLVYLDTLNIFFDEPDTPDGITIEEMASASVIAESLASTIFVPMAAAIAAIAFTVNSRFFEIPYALAWSMVAINALFAIYYLKRACPPTKPS